MPDDNRGVLTRDRNDSRLHVAHRCKTICTHDAGTRLAQRRHKIALVGLFEQMGDNFGVGLARENMSAAFEFLAQLGKILDDAVVHDGDVAAA